MSKKMADGSPCERCKRPTPTQAQWDYEGPLHGDGNGCDCAECVSMCWGDPIDCARASRAKPQRQDSLMAQLSNLADIARREGMYDAEDFVRSHISEML